MRSNAYSSYCCRSERRGRRRRSTRSASAAVSMLPRRSRAEPSSNPEADACSMEGTGQFPSTNWEHAVTVSIGAEHSGLEISRFRHGENLRMVVALAEHGLKRDAAAAVPCCVGKHGEEL